MPPATKGLVELDNYRSAVKFRLCQGILCGNQLLLRFEDLEIAGLTGEITL
ncbi:MAG: hypothetical protein NTW28_16605 [Candidatus Solibacter sp.]|nr:hypothetical protein [Candidatus Solibacter sp.]